MTTYTYSSTDTPKAIVDATADYAHGVTVSTQVASPGRPILAVRIRIDIAHTYDSDLHIYVNHGGVAYGMPYSYSGSQLFGSAYGFIGGYSVELSTKNGGSGDHYTNTVFDDAAATNIRSGTAPFTGSYLPEGLLNTPPVGLSSFVGQDSGGDWTLMVIDDSRFDIGTLLSWSLEIDVEDAPPDPPPDPPVCLVGNYAVLTNSVHAAFSGLACGQTLTAGALTKNNAVATLDNIDTDCRRT